MLYASSFLNVLKFCLVNSTKTLNYLQHTLNFLQVHEEFCHCGNGDISLLIQEQQDTVQFKFQWE